MSQILLSIAYWLHSLATVIFIGYFVLLYLIFLPVLSQDGDAISDISKRSRSWMYTSLLVFIFTGVYLMVADPSYLGVGDFGNLWGVLMLVKHILVLAMIAMGFWYNMIQRVGPGLRSSSDPAGALGRFRKYIGIMAIFGVLVLLLTALAQVE